MPVEWFYQHEIDGQLGPLSSEQLTDLARRGAVLPSTPVQRQSDERVSPWRRAGDIKGLFSHDVSAELGGPICSECGSLLRDDLSCPHCSPPPPPPPHAPSDVLASGEGPPRFAHAKGDASHDLWLPVEKSAPPPPEASRRGSQTGPDSAERGSVNMAWRYPTLRAYLNVLGIANTWAAILIGMGILLTLYFTYANEKASGYDSPTTFIVCVIVGGATILGFFTTASSIELVMVILDIENHARQIELHTRPRPEQPEGDSSE
jgi:hypothetical protein